MAVGICIGIFAPLNRPTQLRLWLLSAASLLGAIVIGCNDPIDIEEFQSRVAEGHTLYADGYYEELEPHAWALISDAERSFGKQSEQTADAIDLLVMSLDRQGRQREQPTLDWAQRAFEIREAVGTETPGLALTLQNLAILVWIRGDSDTAREYLERSLAIRRATLGERDPLVADSIDVLGVFISYSGDRDLGRKLMTEALELRKEILPPMHPDIGDSYASLGGVELIFGNFEVARPLLEQAADIHLQAWDHPHPKAGTTSHNLATTCHPLGDFECARTHYEHALRIREVALIPGHHVRATTHQSFAGLLQATGDFARARYHFRRALEEHETGPESPENEVAHALHNLGLLLADSGDHAEAIRHSRQALDLRVKTMEPGDLRIVDSQTTMGTLLVDQGELSSGKEYLDTALAELRSQDQLRTDLAANVYVGQAALAMHETRLSDAQRFLEEAISIQLERHGEDSIRVVRARASLADLLLVKGQSEEADQQFRLALRTVKSELGPDSPRSADLLSGRARALVAQGNFELALEAALDSTRIGIRQLALTIRGMAERQALLYSEVTNAGLDLALSLAVRAENPVKIGEIWDARIRSRAMVMEELARKNKLLSASNDPAQAEAVREYRLATKRLANVLVQQPRGTSREEYQLILADARRVHEAAEQRLGEGFEANQSSNVQVSNLDTVATALPQNATLVAYTHFGKQVSAGVIPSYGAFVLRGRSARPEFHALGPSSAIDPLIQKWREKISTASSGFEAVGRDLRARVWDPLRIDSSQSESLVLLVPDGGLNLINLSTLPTDDGRFLIEDGLKFHLLTSERDLMTAEDVSTRTASALILGGVDFEQSDKLGSGARDSKDAVWFRGQTSRCVDFQRIRFEPLAATQSEVAEVASLWGAADAGKPNGLTVLTGMSANEASFKRLAPKHRIIHVATHGFFLNGDCGTSRAQSRGVMLASAGSAPTESAELEGARLSGLALAGANARSQSGPEDEDGILTAEEVGTMDLHGVDLVVLSACETGLGDVLSGEGVRGLQRSFRVAGVDTVVMSLWRVEDQAALEWMRVFYEHRIRDDRSLADSIYASTLESLERRRSIDGNDHPAFWGLFVASGNWR